MKNMRSRLGASLALLGALVAACSMQPTTPVVPDPESIEDGSYLTGVLAGEASDTLTTAGSEVLAEDLSDADLEALAETDWTTPLDQLVKEVESVKKLLTSLATVYDEHFAAIPVSLTLPTAPTDATIKTTSDAGDTVSLRGAVIAALLDKQGTRNPDRCALSADDIRALGGSNPPSGPLIVLGECVTGYKTPALPPEIASKVEESCAGGSCTNEETGHAIWTAAGITVLRDLLTDVSDAIPRLLTGLTDALEVTYIYPSGYTYKATYTYMSDGTALYTHRNDDEGTPGYGETGIIAGTWTYYWGFDPPFDPGRLAFRVTIVWDTCIQDRPQPPDYRGLTTFCDYGLLPANDVLPPGLWFRDYAPTDDPDVFLTESADIWHTARRQR